MLYWQQISFWIVDLEEKIMLDMTSFDVHIRHMWYLIGQCPMSGAYIQPWSIKENKQFFSILYKPGIFIKKWNKTVFYVFLLYLFGILRLGQNSLIRKRFAKKCLHFICFCKAHTLIGLNLFLKPPMVTAKVL